MCYPIWIGWTWWLEIWVWNLRTAVKLFNSFWGLSQFVLPDIQIVFLLWNLAYKGWQFSGVCRWHGSCSPWVFSPAADFVKAGIPTWSISFCSRYFPDLKPWWAKLPAGRCKLRHSLTWRAAQCASTMVGCVLGTTWALSSGLKQFLEVC